MDDLNSQISKLERQIKPSRLLRYRILKDRLLGDLEQRNVSIEVQLLVSVFADTVGQLLKDDESIKNE